MKRWAASIAGVAIALAALASPASADPHGNGGGRGAGGGHAQAGPQGYPRGGYAGPPRGPPSGTPWRGPGEPQPGGPPMGWDGQRNDGYWIGNRWHYGPPPEAMGPGPGYRPGYAPWRRGALLPPYYRNDVVDDYWRYHLRRPPMGYHWVRVGDSFLMVSMDSGLIFDVIEGF